MRYYVVVVEDCTPVVHLFDNESAKDTYVKAFLLTNQNTQDNYIDYMFEGDMVYRGEGITLIDHVKVSK